MNKFTSRRERQPSGGSDITIKSDSPSMIESPAADAAVLYQQATDMEGKPLAATVPPAPLSLISEPPIHGLIVTSPVISHSVVQSPMVASSPAFHSSPISSLLDDQHPDMLCQSLLRTLTGRGTGQHVCPWRLQCSKGGVKDSQVVVFERNSAYRYV